MLLNKAWGLYTQLKKLLNDNIFYMNTTEFGKRVLAVREQLLQMNQSELAAQINTTQVLLSRVERGIGGNINVVFDFLNFLRKKGYQSHILFKEPFDIELLTTSVVAKPSNKQILKIIEQLKESAHADFEQTILLMEMIRNK
jgi:transcriptional regulator with XRE-family HTH domain